MNTSYASALGSWARNMVCALLLTSLAACTTTSQEPAMDSPAQATVEAPGSHTIPLADIGTAALLDCAREQGVTLLQAHRAGPVPGAAENSINAINRSLTDGALLVEIDVARSADGVLVLMHDDTLDRTTTGTGYVNAQSYAALSALELKDKAGMATGEPVPTLAQALQVLDGRGIAQLDRKRSVNVAEIAAVVEARDAFDKVVFITYTVPEAIDLYRQFPQALISTGINSLNDLEALRAAGVPFGQLMAWLGLGHGNVELDQALAELGIESSYGDFAAERDGSVDYRRMADNGGEVLSVDHVRAAAQALDAPDAVSHLLADCAPPPASRF